MGSLTQQVEKAAIAARSEVERLLRSPTEASQVEALRSSGMDARSIAKLYPMNAESYPPRIRALLASSGAPWLRGELAKLDPTAYCLYLPATTYQRLRPELPALPEAATPEQELTYTATFVTHLAAESLTLRWGLGVLDVGSEEHRWRNLLHQLEQINAFLRAVSSQLSPTGRLLIRLRNVTR